MNGMAASSKTTEKEGSLREVVCEYQWSRGSCYVTVEAQAL